MIISRYSFENTFPSYISNLIFGWTFSHSVIINDCYVFIVEPDSLIHIVNIVDREGKTVKSFTDPLFFQSLFRAQCEKAIATCGIEYR